MKVSRIRTSAFLVETSGPESDGTLSWTNTVLVTVEIVADDATGFGYTYADLSTAQFIQEHLAPLLLGADFAAPAEAFGKMEVAVRNVGRDGVGATAIAAADMALWDARARLLGVSLVDLVGAVRTEIDAYASAGFTSYSIDELTRQMTGYREQGFGRVKMKIGDQSSTLERVRAVRGAIGPDVQLFVDANGAFTAKHASGIARGLSDLNVRWFEEPVSSDDLEGLRYVREHAPAGMDIAAGEYGYRSRYFEQMVAAGAVDVLQADATRCGVTGFLRAATLCEARGIPLSAHCAPTIHAHLGCAAPTMVHVEYFHDHARIEGALFDGAAVARRGVLRPDRQRPGLGVVLKRAEADAHRRFDAESFAGRT